MTFSASPIAADAMWNIPQSTAPADLLASVVRELMHACGYYGDDESVIAATVNALSRAMAGGFPAHGEPTDDGKPGAVAGNGGYSDRWV